MAMGVAITRAMVGGDERADHNRPDVGEEAFSALDLGGRCCQCRNGLDNKEKRHAEQDGEDEAPGGQGGAGKDLIPGAACALGTTQGGGGHSRPFGLWWCQMSWLTKAKFPAPPFGVAGNSVQGRY